ncbi:hypothetical protein J3R30DRAFT_2594055 [Lentinula aciculospora]|uniref:Uncharacterized protein n=1 Tax=Lentinula aciculospora TaxID=153920 RepID=A0A9W9ADE6_9AGAR|nr:hypothetical protein J3R30DRAFT_2594055 [Lentinula aciculospora]
MTKGPLNSRKRTERRERLDDAWTGYSGSRNRYCTNSCKYSLGISQCHCATRFDMPPLFKCLTGMLQNLLMSLSYDKLNAFIDHNRLKNFIGVHHSLMSLVRRFLAEIFVQNFCHCLPRDRYPVRSFKDSEALLLVISICRARRQLTLSCPRLWSALHDCIVLWQSVYNGYTSSSPFGF